VYINLRRLEEAEGAFRKSTTLDPKDWLAWTGLGILLHEDRGCYDEAQQAYRRAIDLVPDEDLPWWALGRLLDEKLDSYEEAERAYRKALECDPEYAPAWVSLGKLLHTKLARYAEAENAYRKAVELQPEYPDTYILLGLLLQEGFRRYEDAEQAYRKAISLSPHLGGAYAQLGRLLHKEMKRYSEAEIAYEQAVHLEPLVSVIWQWRLELAMERADGVTRVLDLLGKVLAAHPKEVGLRNDLAWEVYRLRALPFLEQAAVWARQAVDLAPEDPYCRHTLASILCLSGRYEEALQEARKYLENGRALQDTLADTISLFVGFAASGCAREALDVLHDQPTTEELEPLTVALRLCVGEDVNVATEIMEVAKDVVTRIEERRAELESLRAAQDQQDTGPTSCDSGNAKNASDK
jgi:tetratricopeptide (TPR) repeat protein